MSLIISSTDFVLMYKIWLHFSYGPISLNIYVRTSLVLYILFYICLMILLIYCMQQDWASVIVNEDSRPSPKLFQRAQK